MKKSDSCTQNAADHICDDEPTMRDKPFVNHKIDKYEAGSLISKTRKLFALPANAISTLKGLLSFHTNRYITHSDQLVIHASNRALMERCDHRALSTLQRHISSLERAGLIQRIQSPNGKRYKTHHSGGTTVYGISLHPILDQWEQIKLKAREIDQIEADKSHLNRQITIKQRAIRDKCETTEETDKSINRQAIIEQLDGIPCSRQRRAKDLRELQEIMSNLEALESSMNERPTSSCTQKMRPRDTHFETQIQNTKKNIFVKGQKNIGQSKLRHTTHPTVGPTPLPFQEVMTRAPEILEYSLRKPSTWQEYVSIADEVAKFMGINPRTWNAAKQLLGPEKAAIACSYVLRKYTQIRSHSAYLQSLINKQSEAKLSTESMLRP